MSNEEIAADQNVSMLSEGHERSFDKGKSIDMTPKSVMKLRKSAFGKNPMRSSDILPS